MDGQYRFGVPRSGERVGAVVAAQLVMIVDFTVHDHHGSFGALHRLLARLEVDDGESSVCKSNEFVHPNIVFIGATVMLEAIHTVQHA
jgi:hypothetical protein